MNERGPQRSQTKTWSVCGGTWPSHRRICLACGANLEALSAQPAGKGQAQEPLDWGWLNALAAEEGAGAETGQPQGEKTKPGCLARPLPGLG
jgi:hypothetical protein